MSAGICGKRLGLEEIFGSPASAPPPAAKRSRCARYGSPVRGSPPDLGHHLSLGFDDKLVLLLRTFPSMDREIVESILKTHDNKLDDAIKSLHALYLGDDSAITEAVHLKSDLQSNDNASEGVMSSETSNQNIQGAQRDSVGSSTNLPENRSSWVEIFVQEMMNASDWNDVRGRAMKILEAFERSVTAQTTASVEHEISTLKEQLQCLLRDNQILKKAVSIQHERNIEHEEKLREVQQLKHVISQYQEQVRTLEMNNYALKIHLQRAQEANSIPGQFHPDIF